VHQELFKHPLAGLGPSYARAFNIGPYPGGSGPDAPDQARHDKQDFSRTHGATYRQVFDLADWDKGLATSAPGQSGQPGSPHYDDLAPLWNAGQYFPLAFSREKVEEVTRHRLVLNPGP
jgi:penicillin amidase